MGQQREKNIHKATNIHRAACSAPRTRGVARGYKEEHGPAPVEPVEAAGSMRLRTTTPSIAPEANMDWIVRTSHEGGPPPS